MYTAYPDPEEDVTTRQITLEVSINKESKIPVDRIEAYIMSHTGADFAGISSPPENKTQFTHEHKSRKVKGGKPPFEFYLVDSFVDLQLAFSNGNYREAYALYLFLRRFVP